MELEGFSPNNKGLYRVQLGTPVQDVNGNWYASLIASVTGVYDVVSPALTNGQVSPLQLDAAGNLQTNLNTYLAGEDRTLNDLTPTGVQAIQPRNNKYIINSAALANGNPKMAPCYLAGISITDPGTAWVINIYDANSALGTPIVVKPTAPGAIPFFGILMKIGIFVTTSGTTAGTAVLAYD